MADIEIKRGYEALPDNSVRFGIRVVNNSPAAILDVEVILDYPDSLFNLQDSRIQKLGNIAPAKERTAKFVLKPLGCVHQEYIGATIQYNDHTYEKHLLNMRRKKIHCVCPFLRAKSMSTAQFLELSLEGHSAEAGLNFEGVSVEQVLSFFMQTCTNRLYRVEERSVDGGKILYLSSESIGEKAYYLLTVLIKDDEGLTQVMMRTVSDKTHGLQGFLNEIVSELKHLVSTVRSAREIGVIKNQQVVNIIDSIVQRSNFSVDGSSGSVNVKDSVMRRSEIDSSAASVNIQDSVVQHTTIKVDSGKKEEDEQLRKERDERERCKQEEQELRRKEEEKRKALEATRLKNTNEAEKNRYSIRKLLAELDAELRQTVTQISDINKPEGNLSKEEQKRLEKLEDKIRILEKRKKRLEGMEVTSESVNQLGNIIFNSNQKKPTRSEDILKAVLQIEKGLNWTQDGLKESIGESSKDKKKTIRNRKKNTDSKPKPYNKVLFLSMLVIAVFVVFSLIENSSDNQNIVVPEYESVDSSAAVSLQDADSDTVQKIEVLQLPWRSDVDIGGDFSLYLLQTDLESNKVYLQCFNDGVIFADKVLGLEGSDSAFWQLIANDVKMVTLIKINENSSCEVEITREIEVSAEDTSNDVSSTKGSLDTYANSIGMEFVKIPSGSFDMGSQSDEEGRNDNEGPIHEVTIEKAYYLGKYEVTQEQWVEVMDSNPSYIKGANNPVENVSWNEVQEFIKSLNEMEGTDKYRLPSEAEWEYACRAGTSTSYSFGDSEPELNDYAWYGDNSGNKAHAVGQKEPNPWGLYDMHGNALEWCQDRCHVSYQEAPTDGSAWEDGSDTSRVWRGGGWGFGAIFCRSASRGYGSPDSAYVDFGFRILKEV